MDAISNAHYNHVLRANAFHERYCQMLWMANHQAAIPAATLVMALAG